MKEITIVGETINEEIKVALIFNSKKTEITIDSEYSTFITDVCSIIKISEEEVDSINLHYFDADQDKINILNEGDYEIFYSQVKDNVVKQLYLEINENSKLDLTQCITNFEKYLETKGEKQDNDEINQKNDENKTQLNRFENEEDEENKNTIYIQEEKIDKDEDNNNKNQINFIDNYFKVNDKENTDIFQGKEVFKTHCKKCKEFPIIEVLYFCEECDMYLCAKCAKKMEDHEHEILEIKSNDQLDDAVKDSFEVIYKESSYNIVQSDENDDGNNNSQQSGFGISNYIPKFIKNYWNKK